MTFLFIVLLYAVSVIAGKTAYDHVILGNSSFDDFRTSNEIQNVECFNLKHLFYARQDSEKIIFFC